MVNCSPYSASVSKKPANTPDLLPMDTSVVIRKMNNGLTYYIKHNTKPQGRIYLRLVINAGSVLEEENQKGLAHFVEHMAFNGTQRFPKQSLVNYLESIGMRFGPDVNAYTSFDETVYMLELPTDSIQFIKTGIQILKDWATAISFDSLEIEKERGVIKEEWRLGTGASERVMKKHLPVLLKGSRYAVRLPIGDTAVIDTFRHKELISFYKKWYRPEWMAVMVVGDFRVDSLEKWIRQEFSTIPPTKKNLVRPKFDVPLPEKSRISVAADSELTNATVSLYQIKKRLFIHSEKDYEAYLIRRMFARMFNRRMYEKMTTTADPPLTYANLSIQGFLRPVDLCSITIGMDAGKIEDAIRFVREEMERIRRFGYSEEEFKRTVTEYKKFMRQIWKERNKQNSTRFFSDFMKHFFFREPVLSIDDEYKIFNRVIERISLDSVNDLTKNVFGPAARILLINVPAQEKHKLPSPQKIMNDFVKPYDGEVKPYTEKPIARQLIDSLPEANVPVKMVYDSTLELYQLSIGNTYRFWLKPTKNKENEIIFRIFSNGGTSRVPDSLYMTASFLDAIIAKSGVGKFSYMDLTKLLANKLAIVRPWISEYREGFWGKTTRKDVETAFQLLYLYFTQPRIDSTAYASYINRIQAMLKNKAFDPASVFSDTVTAYLYDRHYRTRPLSEESLKEIRFQYFLPLYKERFLNGDCFNGVVVGSFNVDSLAQVIRKYFSPLVQNSCIENWQDSGIRYTKKSLEKIVYKGKEPKAEINIFYTGEIPYTPENKVGINLLANVLQIRLREILREDEGGTYYVKVGGALEKIPVPEYDFLISFTTGPDRMNHLNEKVMKIVDSVKTFGMAPVYLKKVKEMFFRSREKQLENNNFWLSLLSRIMQGELPENYLERSRKIVESWDNEDLKKLADTILNPASMKVFILYPEGERRK
jgi:zinc protease